MTGVAGVGLLLRGYVGRDRPVSHTDRPELTVDRAHHGPEATLVRGTDRLDPEQEPLALLEVDRVLLAGLHAVKEVRGRQQGQVAVLLQGLLELLGRARKEQPVQRCAPMLGQALLLLIGCLLYTSPSPRD